MKYFILILLLAAQMHADCQQNQEKLSRPKLVVGIVIDQMRWDFLYRYYDRYSEGGFKRLMTAGFNNQNTFIPFTPTYTAAGHASIYTGSVPAINGIMGNHWYSRELKRTVYCTEDSRMQTVGSNSAAGKMSPANTWTTTITDELRLATNFRSKVISISFKDRGAILPGGHSANAAYWFDETNGHFISSSYYMQQLPGWVEKFNNQKLPDQYLQLNWQSLFPLESYNQSTVDNNSYESDLPGEDNSFPHITSNITSNRYGSFKYMPYANTLTFQMAEAALVAEKLGADMDTDFLALSLSNPDYAGHAFGPNSIEMEDIYLRLDKDLSAFLQSLDSTVGKGEYTVFLTADHGVAHVPGFLHEHKIPAGTYGDAAMEKELNRILHLEFGRPNLVSKVINYQVYLNEQEGPNPAKEQVVAASIKALLKMPFVANAFELKQAHQLLLPAKQQQMIANGYNMKLSGDIQYNYKPQWFNGGSRGTSHGVWYNYDTHIPLLWYGWGIKQGKSHREVYMTDIAPTLAALLNIQMPSGSIGNVIEEVLD